MSTRGHQSTDLFKPSAAGLAASITAVALVAVCSAAQATTFVYGEVQLGDPARNNSSASPDVIGSPPLPAGGLPANGDSLNIDGTLVALAGGLTDNSGPCADYLQCAAGGDWFQFVLGANTPTLTMSMDSSHVPAAGLGFDFFQVGTGPRLASGAFISPSGTGATATGPFAAASSYLVHIWGTAGADGGNPDYSFNVEAIPEPSTYALMAAGLVLVGFLSMRRDA